MNGATTPGQLTLPWLKPGVVLHEQEFAVDDLLAEFAREVRRRGFSIRGFVQANNQPGKGCAERIALTDLANGSLIDLGGGPCVGDLGIDHALRVFRDALTQPTDLVVVGRFAAFDRTSSALGGAVRDGLGAGLPLLTSVAGKCMGRWKRFAGCEGTLLTPDSRSLWRWWGPDRLYQDLVHGIEDDEVRRIVVGPRWLLVEGSRGTGLAHVPRGADHVVASLADYRRRGIRGLAALIHSWDPVERALAVAAVNAALNRPNVVAKPGNGVTGTGVEGAGGRVVVVGAFPGLAQRLPRAQVIETNPRPGEFPAAAADGLLPGCARAILSAACLVNRTLPHLVTLAGEAPISLVGPATPLSPRLHAYGIETLGGFVVDDPATAARAVLAGARPKEFNAFGRFVHITSPSDPRA